MNKVQLDLTNVPPCQCPGPGSGPDGVCPLMGRKMVGRLYELCSGKCPPSRPCTERQSTAFRARWWARAQGREPELLVQGGPPMQVLSAPSAPSSGPGIFRRAVNATKAAATAVVGRVRDGIPFLCPPEVAAERMATCQACEWFDADRGICTHARCGCPLTRRLAGRGGAPGKTQVSTQQCPIGKWGAWQP